MTLKLKTRGRRRATQDRIGRLQIAGAETLGMPAHGLVDLHRQQREKHLASRPCIVDGCAHLGVPCPDHGEPGGDWGPQRFFWPQEAS